jgi:hypothetical protein
MNQLSRIAPQSVHYHGLSSHQARPLIQSLGLYDFNSQGGGIEGIFEDVRRVRFALRGTGGVYGL